MTGRCCSGLAVPAHDKAHTVSQSHCVSRQQPTVTFSLYNHRRRKVLSPAPTLHVTKLRPSHLLWGTEPGRGSGLVLGSHTDPRCLQKRYTLMLLQPPSPNFNRRFEPADPDEGAT